MNHENKPIKVAALYVDPRGVYMTMKGVDCWPESRDARLYDGPHPVVSHPPCGPWSKLRHLCTKQDPTCGPYAVEQVREFGGVLEHPAHSLLWRMHSLPRPGSEFFDAHGGLTYEVDQCDWGHVCRKPTWLYVVGVPEAYVRSRLAERVGSGVPTHCVCTGPRQKRRLRVASKPMKERTPRPFAELLIDLALHVGR